MYFVDSMICVTLTVELNYTQVSVPQSMYIFKQAKIGSAVTPHQDSTFLHTSPKDSWTAWNNLFSELWKYCYSQILLVVIDNLNCLVYLIEIFCCQLGHSKLSLVSSSYFYGHGRLQVSGWRWKMQRKEGLSTLLIASKFERPWKLLVGLKLIWLENFLYTKVRLICVKPQQR